MNQNYLYQNFKPINNYPSNYGYNSNNGDRFVAGGFLGPFILGGITGGLLAPAFYPQPRPYYNNYYYYPYYPRYY